MLSSKATETSADPGAPNLGELVLRRSKRERKDCFLKEDSAMCGVRVRVHATNRARRVGMRPRSVLPGCAVEGTTFPRFHNYDAATVLRQ